MCTNARPISATFMSALIPRRPQFSDSKRRISRERSAYLIISFLWPSTKTSNRFVYGKSGGWLASIKFAKMNSCSLDSRFHTYNSASILQYWPSTELYNNTLLWVTNKESRSWSISFLITYYSVIEFVFGKQK